MKIILGSRIRYYVARVSIFLVAVALVVGMVSCGGGGVEYDLTIASTVGGNVTTPGEGKYTYDEGEVVDLVAVADAGYLFDEWIGDVGTIADNKNPTTTITMNGDYSITANFAVIPPAQYDFIISSTIGGEVTAPGEGIFNYDEGTDVDLVAVAEDGYHFVDWTGDVTTIANVTAAMTSITMNSHCTVTANFAVDLYFETDVYVMLDGPASLSLEERTVCILLNVMTNIVTDRVRVDLPDGGSVMVPTYSDLNSPEVDQETLFRFCTCAPEMPTAAAEYIFTGLDVAGAPIPEARNTDIWVGVDPPDPPTNVRAELTEDGILVSWDERPIIPGSFEPAADPQLGMYQLWIARTETGETVYGAEPISASPHLIPRDKAEFIQGKDRGLSLGEMEDGTYCLNAGLHSVAPEDSLGKGCEYNCCDPGQTIIFTIQDGEITIE